MTLIINLLYLPFHGYAGESPLIPHKPHRGQKFVLVIQGGGTGSRGTATPERQALYKMALKAALEAGFAVLREGEAMDAAVTAVTVLESELSH